MTKQKFLEDWYNVGKEKAKDKFEGGVLAQEFENGLKIFTLPYTFEMFSRSPIVQNALEVLEPVFTEH